MERMLLATAVTVGLLYWNACGLEPAAVSNSEAEATPADGPQELEVHATCTVIGDAELSDPAKMAIYRHEAEPGALGLSIRNLPMTCADRIKLFADWTLDDGGALTLEARGEHYKHCLCAVDLAPFTVAVPPAAEGRLDDFTLVVRRNDSADPSALRAVTIGSLPYR